MRKEKKIMIHFISKETLEIVGQESEMERLLDDFRNGTHDRISLGEDIVVNKCNVEYLERKNK